MKHRTKPHLKEFAREMRKNSTKEERKLWRFVRNFNINNAKFRRQEPIGDYIVDFVCFENKLIIELDGGHHNTREEKEYDKYRELYLESMGYRIIRFWNSEVMNNIDGVLTKISDVLESSP